VCEHCGASAFTAEKDEPFIIVHLPRVFSSLNPENEGEERKGRIGR
jgi:hypothetical protein